MINSFRINLNPYKSGSNPWQLKKEFFTESHACVVSSTLLMRIPAIPDSIFGPKAGYTEVFGGVPQCLQFRKRFLSRP
jgi:hypothetical protein